MSENSISRDFAPGDAGLTPPRLDTAPSPALPAIAASAFRQAGAEGWTGRLMVEKEISDLVVLRPADTSSKDVPVAARERLALIAAKASAVRSAAVDAIFDARSRTSAPGAGAAHWRIVEVRIDKEGKAWIGLYESGHGHNDTWMVELDASDHPCGIWRRHKRDSRNLSDCGERLR